MAEPFSNGASSSSSSEAALRDLGYEYIAAANSSERGHYVLRKVGRPDEGFTWEGQEHFNALGKAVFIWARQQLVDLCGLQELRAVDPGAVAYATPSLKDREAPLLVLVCGDVPGGDAGVWSRNLCINVDTVKGTMFQYIFRAQKLGWSVLVADPHGSDSPHSHMCRLWHGVIRPSKATKLLLVGHSYGGPVSMGLVKAEPAVCDLLGALVTTDGMAWHLPGGWDSIEQYDEGVPSEEDVANLNAEQLSQQGGIEEVRSMQKRCHAFALLTPGAFSVPRRHVRSCLLHIGRNYRASNEPPGTPMRVLPEELLLELSAGHTAHGNTTMACIDSVFDFLERGALGAAGEANDEIRSQAKRQRAEAAARPGPLTRSRTSASM